MSISEQPCYTLINLPTDAEPPTEMQLRQDLGMLLNTFIIHVIGNSAGLRRRSGDFLHIYNVLLNKCHSLNENCLC